MGRETLARGLRRGYIARVIAPPLPELLLFDLDDTVLRFTAGQPDCWQIALEQHLPDLADHTVLLAAIRAEGNDFWAPATRAFWGRQNMQAARRLIACAALASHGIPLSLCHRIADEMTERKEALVRPFEGALEALAALLGRGHRLALLTNGCSEFQRRKLRRWALEPLFELILIEGELGFGKPDRRVFERALAHFGALPRDACMIGDNLEADIAGASAAGIATVWHDAHGTGLPQAPVARPDRVVRSLHELLGSTSYSAALATLQPQAPHAFTASGSVVG
jgi:putative hydrolase of the HAD superfamily